jgi:hypothetical protein
MKNRNVAAIISGNGGGQRHQPSKGNGGIM